MRPTPIVHKLTLMAMRLVALPLRPTARSYLHALIAEDLQPFAEKAWPHTTIKYFAPGKWPFKRSTEGKAEMTDWIDGFGKGAVFWDVGSNVGVYSLYAASLGIRTIAVEPEAGNFYLLQKNIDLNRLHDTLTGLNIGLGEKTGMAGFELSQLAIGTPRHQVRPDGKAKGELPCRNIIVMAARDLPDMLGIPKPTHINIDVDGMELPVVRGLHLADKNLKEVKCEMRRNGLAPAIAEVFEKAGFDTSGAVEEVETSPQKAVNFVFRRR